jgi:hypothetical protein
MGRAASLVLSPFRKRSSTKTSTAFSLRRKRYAKGVGKTFLKDVAERFAT